MQRIETLALVSVAVLLLGKLLPRVPAEHLEGFLLGHAILLVLWIGALLQATGPEAADVLDSWRMRHLPIGIGIGIGAFVLGGVGYVASQRVLGLTQPAELNLVGGMGLRLVLLLGSALAAAFIEEWVFRGVLMDRLAMFPAWATVVASSIVFAVYHLSLFQLLPTFLLGLVLAVSVVTLGSVWPAIVAHMTYNLVGLLLTSLSAGAGRGG